jgi:acylphosphatase
MPTKCFLVSGRVQGVFFRASTKAEAERLGLRGYARNLADGRVEVLVDGESAAVAALERWLWQGPPQAAVTSVAEQPAGEPAPAGFETR